MDNLYQANESYQRPFSPVGPFEFEGDHFGDALGLRQGGDELSLNYSITNAGEVRTLSHTKCLPDQIMQSQYDEDLNLQQVRSSAEEIMLAKRLNIELTDVLIRHDEETEYLEAVKERVTKEAVIHYFHTRANGGDQSHWRVGKDPLIDLELAGNLSADYIKKNIRDEVRNHCHSLKLLLTPLPVAERALRDSRQRCRQPHSKILQEDSVIRFYSAETTSRHCCPDARVWVRSPSSGDKW